jgi:FkbM family methyltransferase
MSAPRPGLIDQLAGLWFKSRLRGADRFSALVGRSERITFRSRAGTIFDLNPTSYIDRIVLTDGDYESEVRLAIASAARAGETVWDIGANFGLHCTTLGKVRPDLKIVAFEPNPDEYKRLLLHRQWNAPQIQTCVLALSERPALLPLSLGPKGNSGMTTLSPWTKATYAGTTLVAATTGDSLVETGMAPNPHIIKIDVEGHESAVLRGLTETLHRPDCHTVVFEDDAATNTESKALLRSAGFEITPLARNERTGHALSNFTAQRHR